MKSATPRFQSIFAPNLFAGQTVLVTGGGTGIGRCIAHELASLGAKVIISARRQEPLDTVVAEIQEAGGTAIAVDDPELLAAHQRLAHRGIFVEPTSATAAAALVKLRPHIKPGETVVVILTGHGLKRPPAF